MIGILFLINFSEDIAIFYYRPALNVTQLLPANSKVRVHVQIKEKKVSNSRI